MNGRAEPIRYSDGVFRLRTSDDRGKPVKLYRTGILPIRAPGEHPVDPNAWARARRDAHSTGVARPANFQDSVRRDALVRWLPIALGPGTAWLIAMVIAWVAGVFPWGMMILAFLLFGVVWALILWKRRCGFLEFRPRLIISAMLRQSLCPACGYSLRLVPVSLDACRVCPECGAAWKIEGEAADRRDA